MRVIKEYCFDIGTKLPFAQWPEIVHRFLEENGLSCCRFLYHFSEYVHEPEVRPKACERLRKDCPDIGECRPVPTAVNGLSEWVLTNIDREGGFREEELLPLMGRIHRSYGFAQAALYYCDVDFFGSVIPFEREGELDSHGWQLHGSGITLYRDAVFNEAQLILSIDVLRDGQLMDASPYCEAMQRLLPKVKVKSSQKIVLTEAEKRRIAQINQDAEPVLEKCRGFFRERLPERWAQTLDEARYSLAAAMKKLGKQHGYTYSMVWAGGTFGLEKRTERGNAVFITADAGPSRTRTELCVYFQGLGFHHELIAASFAPTCQEELETMLRQAMGFVEAFERSLLPELDALFPECPPWFEPHARP